MLKLKERLSTPSKAMLLAERAAVALCFLTAFLRLEGAFVIPLLALGLVLGFCLIWLCSLNVNGFGFIFAVFLEYYSFQMEAVAQLAMLFFAFLLFFASFTRDIRTNKSSRH